MINFDLRRLAQGKIKHLSANYNELISEIENDPRFAEIRKPENQQIKAEWNIMKAKLAEIVKDLSLEMPQTKPPATTPTLDAKSENVEAKEKSYNQINNELLDESFADVSVIDLTPFDTEVNNDDAAELDDTLNGTDKSASEKENRAETASELGTSNDEADAIPDDLNDLANEFSEDDMGFTLRPDKNPPTSSQIINNATAASTVTPDANTTDNDKLFSDIDKLTLALANTENLENLSVGKKVDGTSNTKKMTEEENEKQVNNASEEMVKGTKKGDGGNSPNEINTIDASPSSNIMGTMPPPPPPVPVPEPVDMTATVPPPSLPPIPPPSMGTEPEKPDILDAKVDSTTVPRSSAQPSMTGKEFDPTVANAKPAAITPTASSTVIAPATNFTTLDKKDLSEIAKARENFSTAVKVSGSTEKLQRSADSYRRGIQAGHDKNKPHTQLELANAVTNDAKELNKNTQNTFEKHHKYVSAQLTALEKLRKAALDAIGKPEQAKKVVAELMLFKNQLALESRTLNPTSIIAPEIDRIIQALGYTDTNNAKAEITADNNKDYSKEIRSLQEKYQSQKSDEIKNIKNLHNLPDALLPATEPATATPSATATPPASHTQTVTPMGPPPASAPEPPPVATDDAKPAPKAVKPAPAADSTIAAPVDESKKERKDALKVADEKTKAATAKPIEKEKAPEDKPVEEEKGVFARAWEFAKSIKARLTSETKEDNSQVYGQAVPEAPESVPSASSHTSSHTSSTAIINGTNGMGASAPAAPPKAAVPTSAAVPMGPPAPTDTPKPPTIVTTPPPPGDIPAPPPKAVPAAPTDAPPPLPPKTPDISVLRNSYGKLYDAVDALRVAREKLETQLNLLIKAREKAGLEPNGTPKISG